MLPDLPETQPAVAHHLPAVPPAIDVPVGGWWWLRLWCSRCCSCVDTMPELGAICTWPPRVQPATRPCRAIALQPQARLLLLFNSRLTVSPSGRSTHSAGMDREPGAGRACRRFCAILHSSCWVRWARHPTGRHPGETASRSTACHPTTGTSANCRPKLPPQFPLSTCAGFSLPMRQKPDPPASTGIAGYWRMGKGRLSIRTHWCGISLSPKATR